MSIEYYDPESSNAKAPHPGIQKSLPNGGINGKGGDGSGMDSGGESEDKDKDVKTNNNNNNNPNKRYLECPGSVKVQHLKKFITMKYGLNEDFLVSFFDIFTISHRVIFLQCTFRINYYWYLCRLT